MSRLHVVDYREMENLLLILGFQIVRQKGSHVRFEHADGRQCTVPNHGGRDLSRPLIRKILQDIDMTVEQYHDKLEKL